MNVPRWLLAWVVDHAVAIDWQFQHLFDSEVPERYAEGELAPVLLLPGVYETWQFLRPIGDRLNRAGHPVFAMKVLGYNRQPILDSAKLAARLIVQHDLSHLVIVGHSKGGLIGKQLMVTDAVASRIDRMVAINSPFSGSRIARFAPGITLRAFAPRNETLAALAKNLEANSRIVSIFSTLDPVLPEGSKLESAKNIELPLIGHFRPLRKQLLLDTVTREIDGEKGAANA